MTRWICILALTAGCSGRGVGAADLNDNNNHDPPDGSVTPLPDGSVDPDGEIRPFDCRAQDARSGETTCGLFLGYAWNGSDCMPINCTCEGSDCGSLFEEYGECMAGYAPQCLPPTDCSNMDYEQCEASDQCQYIYYGGGCMNPETCTNEGNWEDMICWERGVACVPAGHPCNERSREECDGACYWVGFEHEMCFGEDCCITEQWGYCHGYNAPDCRAQQVFGCPDPCGSVEGAYWDGQFCQPIICCCEGPDCGETYESAEACMNDRRGCSMNECAAAAGYCDYGDAEHPTCVDGYGEDLSITAGTCGMGICCTPCPDENDPDVTYFGLSPMDCADIDWGCYANSRAFDNECGCGCILL